MTMMTMQKSLSSESNQNLSDLLAELSETSLPSRMHVKKINLNYP